MREKMNNNILISIVVPVYNAEAYIGRCIDSIVKQQLDKDKWELILVNDGSTDNSLRICQKYANNNHNITIIDKKNEGVSISRKRGFNASNGKYVMFVDSDDWLEKNSLNKLSIIAEMGTSELIVFDYYLCNEGGSSKIERHTGFNGRYGRKELEDTLYPYLIHDKKGHSYRTALWGNLIKREILDKYLLADKNAQIGEDGAVILPVLYNSKSVYFMSDCLYNYYLCDTSMTRIGRVYDSEGPYIVNSFIERNIDMDAYDFKQQMNRKITHDVFNVCCSYYNSSTSIHDIKEKMDNLLNREYYNNAIKASKFTNFYYLVARKSMLQRWYFIIRMINFIKRIILNRLY